MKKISCVILSFILVLSAGAVDVLAMEDTEEGFLYEESERDPEGSIENQEKSESEDTETASLTGENMEDTDAKGDQASSLESNDNEDGNQETQNQDEILDNIEPLGVSQDTTITWTEIDLPRMKYDDRCSLDSIIEEYGADVKYEISEINSVSESCQVVSGVVTETEDEVITQVDDSLDIIATGVGIADIYLVPVGQDNTDKSGDDSEPAESDGQTDNDNSTGDPDPVENGLKVSVEVEKATLTLMFLTGQSNMEGLCSDYTGQELDASIACDEGTVYSTYAPTNNNANKITGISFSKDCDVSNAADFVAGSLQSDTSISGEKLEYPLDSLTLDGSGKTGPDSGLAYEWNKLTHDKVWVINTAWSGTNISSWQPGASLYERSSAVWDCVKQVYDAEICAGHYDEGNVLAFWLQGETGDKTKAAADYKTDFTTMSNAMMQELGLDALGIIMVRSSVGSCIYDDELEMTGPRIAQYMLGGSGGLSRVYVATNANEQWVSDAGVKSYFQSAYPDGSLSYPMHNDSKTELPTTVEAVHSDIHYSQIGHNENGITAAFGIYQVLEGSTTPTEIQWRNEEGKEISSLNIAYSGEKAILIPVANPVYTGKSISYSVSGNSVSFDASNGIVTPKEAGTSVITASYNGNILSQIPVMVDKSSDLSAIAGKDFTGIFYYEGTWWYLVNGVIQNDYEGVEKNENGWWYINKGRVDFSYTGFAQNKNGWWYIENGAVKFDTNSVIKDTNKKIDGTDSWWYVVGGQVQESFTGLADYSNSSGWWYISNGKVSFDVDTVAKNKNGWYYVEGSKVNFNYNGFAENSNGWWYIKDGAVKFDTNSVIKDTNKKIDGTDSWWYVVGGQVQKSFTGLADYSNSNGWWYISNGKVSFDVDTVAKNKNGWYYVKDSKVNFSYNGFAENSNGWWYIENGSVTFHTNNVIKGTVKGSNGWWYVVSSEVRTDYTGVADYSNSNGWWYIKNGKVDFSFDGIASNRNGLWYIRNGKVDFSYNGTCIYDGITYTIVNGGVQK